jgi:long-chain acyl-CoA synthetase
MRDLAVARVALLAPPGFAWVAGQWGVWRAGGIAVPLAVSHPLPEHEHVIRDAEARIVLAHPELAEAVAPIAAACGARLLTTAEALTAAPATRLPALDETRRAMIIYTSGTTGRPKGVMLAHRSFVAVVAAMRAAGDPWIGWSPADTSLLGIPSFHIGGMWWAMTGFNAGAANVVVPSFAGWRVLQAIARHRVTKACLVPAMLQVCLSEPDCAGTDFSSLRTIVYGGSPIPRPVLETALRTFGCGFAQIYGLTETGNTAVCLRPDDHLRPELHHAAGRPYPGVRIAIVDAEGRALGPGAIGEICIASPANMLGYWNRPEATAAVLRDGFVHTGDAGYVDAAGYVFVCDRLKDMICTAGENVYPAEVESVLCAHPAVAEAAVIGVPDERWGELVKAIVVLRPGMAATAAELLAAARTQIADFKVPRSIDFASVLPRTPSGKIQKHVLREPYWAGRSRRVN